jgi:hypothetical protein
MTSIGHDADSVFILCGKDKDAFYSCKCIKGREVVVQRPVAKRLVAEVGIDSSADESDVSGWFPAE